MTSPWLSWCRWMWWKWSVQNQQGLARATSLSRSLRHHKQNSLRPRWMEMVQNVWPLHLEGSIRLNPQRITHTHMHIYYIYIILYYIILYYIILYNIILYYIILCYIILYYIILYYVILYYIISYYTILYYIILYYIILCYIILYHIILYHIILYCIILYYIISYYIISYYIILFYIILYCIIYIYGIYGSFGPWLFEMIIDATASACSAFQGSRMSGIQSIFPRIDTKLTKAVTPSKKYELGTWPLGFYVSKSD